MLKSDWDKKICAQYGAFDKEGKTHCYECPLRLPQVYKTACKATYHWSRERREWVEDDSIRIDDAE